MKQWTWIAALILCVQPALAQDDLGGADEWLGDIYNADEPGIAAIVVRDGEVLFRAAYGMADLENGLALTPSNVFGLGSITKQFTAAGIMLLAEEGKLSLDDPIIKYLPEYPTHGYEITIHHLLTHTSGLMDYLRVPGWIEENARKQLTPDALIETFKAAPMKFAPGTRYSYSNSGYALASVIIEKVSGQDYATFMQERIFKPLGLDATFYGDHLKLIPNRARGYVRTPDGFQNADFLDMSGPYGAGALLSTVDDLATWFRALATGRLVSPESYSAMTAPPNLPGGAKTNYAYGIARGQLRGRTTHEHGGSIFGFNTYAIWLPEEKIYVAVLRNMNGAKLHHGYVVRKLAALALADPYTDLTSIDVDPEILAGYAGTYQAVRGFQISLEVENGTLMIKSGRPTALRPLSEDRFFREDSFFQYGFVREERGQVMHLLLYSDPEDTAPLVLDRLPHQEPEATE